MSLIHFSKVSALTILAVTIVACSSGGNHTKISPITPPLSEQDAADKAAADKAAADKAAADKAAADKAAADKAAADKAAADKAAADKAAADKAAADKAAADKAAADKVEKERLQKIEANRLALNKKAQDAGLSTEQAAAYAEANKEAQAKAAQEALNSIVAENTRIATKKSELIVKAQVAGLNADRAKQFADNNVNTAETSIAKALNAEVSKAVIADKGGIYEKGLTTDNKVTSQSSSSQYIQTPYGSRYITQTKTESSLKKTYDQPYSVVVGSGTMTTTTDNYNGTQTTNNFGIDKVAGLATLEQNVPSVGRAVYTGQAFSSIDKNGDFSYLVDFDKRKGSGEITGWQEEFGDVKLKEGNLKKVNVGGKTVVGVSGTWSGNTDGLHVAETSESQGSYTLGLFGPKAEEVAGTATVNSVLTAMHTGIQAGNSYVVGFGGQKNAKALLKRQAIEAGLTEKRAQDYASTNVNKSEEVATGALTSAVAQQNTDKSTLIKQGKNSGLNDTFASQYAVNNIDTNKTKLADALDSIALQQANQIKKTAIDTRAGREIGTNKSFFVQIDDKSNNPQGQKSQYKATQYIYRQPYSIVVGTALDTNIKDGIDSSPEWTTYMTSVSGFATPETALPTVGKATYTGKGVYMHTSYDLNYNVDFAKRVGSGTLTGEYILTHFGNSLNLNEGQIKTITLNDQKVTGISGIATGTGGNYINQDGTYQLGFFGPRAQEISGRVEMPADGMNGYGNNNKGMPELGFGGTRGEISKK